MQSGLFNGFGSGINPKKGDMMAGGVHHDHEKIAAGGDLTVLAAKSNYRGGYRIARLSEPHVTSTVSDTAIGLPGVHLVTTLNQKPSASTIMYQPFYVASPILISEASLNVQSAGTAGAKARVALYYCGDDMMPGNLVEAVDEYYQRTGRPIGDIGEYDVASTGRKDTTGLSITLDRGLYMVSLHTDAAATTPTFSTFRGYSLHTPAQIGKTNWQFIYQYTLGTAYAAAANPAAKWNTLATSSGLFIYYVLFRWTTL
jgi:hypothetical protein